MSGLVYRPDQYTISIGIPDFIGATIGLTEFISTAYEISDWTTITANKPVDRFQHSNGIFGEPFVNYTRNTSRVFSLSILQTSKDARILREIFNLQTFGEIGFPFYISNDVDQANLDERKQKSAYPVAYIIDEPAESWAIEGATWVFRIQAVAGATIFL